MSAWSAAMTSHSDAIRLQEELARKVIAADDFGRIKNVCGVDVAYIGDTAYCSAVIMDRAGKAVIETASSVSAAKNPYIPGLLMLREAEPILHTLEMLKKNYDLLLVDGHGQLHPRKCGLACYLGIKLGKPAIGVAKRLLCGNLRDDGFIEYGGEILGFALPLGGRKKIYVSVGHRVSLKTAVEIVRDAGRGMPEPLRLADFNSKMQKRGRGLS
ncbi:MAG: endonuclease V [Nitrososphaera sp.]